MDELMKKFISVYLGISLTDAFIKLNKLNYIYFKAKKAATKLTYKKGLMSSSKENLKLPKIMHMSAIFNLCKYSFNPINTFSTTKNLFINEKDFLEGYIDLFDFVYKEINLNEELERAEVAKNLADIYCDFKDYLPDNYKGESIKDETIRISRKEMIKFLKKNNIILEEIQRDDDYIDYNVLLLKK